MIYSGCTSVGDLCHAAQVGGSSRYINITCPEWAALHHGHGSFFLGVSGILCITVDSPSEMVLCDGGYYPSGGGLGMGIKYGAQEEAGEHYSGLKSKVLSLLISCVKEHLLYILISHKRCLRGRGRGHDFNNMKSVTDMTNTTQRLYQEGRKQLRGTLASVSRLDMGRAT